MDFTDYDTRRAEEGQFMPLKDPVTGKEFIDPDAKEPCGIVLMGADSAAYREAENEIMAARTADAGNKEAFTADRIRGEIMDRLVACTVEFRHVTFAGKPVEKKASSIRAAYARLPWAREQALAFIENRANFLPKPPAN